MPFASLSDALDVIASNDIVAQKAMSIENLTDLITLARPSMSKEAPSIAQSIKAGKVEKMSWQTSVLNWKTGSVYITFTSSANQYALWQIDQKTGGTAGTNNAGSNQLDVITWIGMYMNHDVQNATFEEIARLGKFYVQYGEQQRPRRLRPLREILINRISKEYRLGSTSAEINARLQFQGNSSERGGFKLDPHEPIVVKVGDSLPRIEIAGLSSTIAGSTPTLTVQAHIQGYRIRL